VGASSPVDDFTPGPDKEQAGVVRGRPTYAPKVPTITATPAMRAGAQSMMERDGVVPMPRSQAPMPRGPASQPERTLSTIAPTPPPRANDPDIIRKDNVAAANYQSSFSGGNPSDTEFDAAKNGQKNLYDNASSLDQAKLAANTLRRSGALPQVVAGSRPTPQQFNSYRSTSNPDAPRATVVPARKPILPGLTRPVFAMARR
jgi:hypothetical protein